MRKNGGKKYEKFTTIIQRPSSSSCVDGKNNCRRCVFAGPGLQLLGTSACVCVWPFLWHLSHTHSYTYVVAIDALCSNRAKSPGSYTQPYYNNSWWHHTTNMCSYTGYLCSSKSKSTKSNVKLKMARFNWELYIAAVNNLSRIDNRISKHILATAVMKILLFITVYVILHGKSRSTSRYVHERVRGLLLSARYICINHIGKIITP